MKWTKSFIAAAVATAIVGCGEAPQQVNSQPLAITLFEVEQAVSIEQSQFQGVALPSELTELSFKQSGKLAELLVNAGERVEKGDVIARLENSKEQQQLKDATVKYDLAKTQLKRAQSLISREMISQAQYDELAANLTLSKISLQLAQRQLEFTQLRAPFSGLIAEVPATQFQVVSPGGVIATLYDAATVQVTATVPDKFVLWLQQLEDISTVKASVVFANQQQSLPVELRAYSGEPDRANNSYIAQFEMAQLDPPILPGTSASVLVEADNQMLEATQAVRVPLNILVAGEGENNFIVWKYEQGEAVKQPVKVRDVDLNGAVVTSGVALGDQLIASSLLKIGQGSELVVVEGTENR